MEVLCRQALLQPVNRKGQYLALKSLLPYMPTSQSIKVESLLEGVGDHGPKIADLWTKLLGHLWTDICKLSDDNSTFETWKCHWVPSLSMAVVAQSLSRRKQVAAFCLPCIMDLMRGSDSLRGHLSNSFVAPIEEVGILSSSKSNMASLDSSERQNDGVLWALLVIFNCRRHPIEVETMNKILKTLLSTEMFAVLFALLHSIWDNTRSVAFHFLSKLVVTAQSFGVHLPTEYYATKERHALKARAVFLASSPRQREADTGARILAFLYFSLEHDADRDSFLSGLVELIKSRISSMKEKLRYVLNHDMSIEKNKKHQQHT